MRSWAFGISALALIVLSSYASAQNLITNAGFETGDLTGYTSTGQVGVYANTATGEYYPGLGGGVPQGTYAANFGAGGGAVGKLSQTFATIAGQTYSSSALFARAGPSDSAGLTFEFFNAASKTNASLSPAPVTINDSGTGVFKLYDTGSFVAASNVTSLVITNPAGGCCSDLLLDAVTVTPAPEPTTLAAIGLGAFGLFASRRRR